MASQQGAVACASVHRDGARGAPSKGPCETQVSRAMHRRAVLRKKRGAQRGLAAAAD